MTSCVGAIARLSLITAISGNIWYARNMGKFDIMKMTVDFKEITLSHNYLFP